MKTSIEKSSRQLVHAQHTVGIGVECAGEGAEFVIDFNQFHLPVPISTSDRSSRAVRPVPRGRLFHQPIEFREFEAGSVLMGGHVLDRVGGFLRADDAVLIEIELLQQFGFGRIRLVCRWRRLQTVHGGQ